MKLTASSIYPREKEVEIRDSAKYTFIICLFAFFICGFYVCYGLYIGKYEIATFSGIYSLILSTALILNAKGKSTLAKALLTTTASGVIAMAYHIFTFGHSVLTHFFPVILLHLYFFDFDKEKKTFLLSLAITVSVIIASLVSERFIFLKIELSETLVRQANNVHGFVSLIITSFLLVLITQNKARINRSLTQKKEELESTIEKLSETRIQLIQTEKMASLGLLTAGINHEINNPLNFMIGGLENIKKLKGKKTVEDIEPYLDVFEEGVKRISHIVSSLNHFNHQSSSFEDECDLTSILDNCISILSHKAKEGIGIEKRFSEKPIIKGNRGQLHQVFLNLISNAVQAIEDEGCISVSMKQQNNNVIKVDIIDNGLGMAEHTLNRIFDPFFTTKEAGVGTGLGLSIAYNIVKNHHGEILVSSEKGKGTIFTVLLPTYQKLSKSKRSMEMASNFS